MRHALCFALVGENPRLITLLALAFRPVGPTVRRARKSFFEGPNTLRTALTFSVDNPSRDKVSWNYSMKPLIRNSGIFFLLFHFLVWLPTPINSLHATSLGPSNGNGVKEESAQNGKAHSLNGFERVTHRIRRGDTLGNLLRPYGLSGKEQENWVRSIRKQYSPRRLRPGQEIYFLFLLQRPYE